MPRADTGAANRTGAEARCRGGRRAGSVSDTHSRRQLINILRGCRGLSPLPVQRSRRQEKEDAYNRLADTVAASLDMEKLHAIMEERS